MTLLQIQTRNSSQSCGLVSWVEEVEVSTGNEQNQSKSWVHIWVDLSTQEVLYMRGLYI